MSDELLPEVGGVMFVEMPAAPYKKILSHVIFYVCKQV